MERLITPRLHWILFISVTLLPLGAWLNNYDWNPPLTPLGVFPLLGVWAWSIMWTHYANGWLRLRMPDICKPNKVYDKWSTWIVLSLLLLHPLLLAAGQYQLRGITPPESYFAGIDPALRTFVTFGLIGLPLFLAYDVFIRIKEAAWVKRTWGWISVSQIIAMVLIFFHGLSIGDSVLYGWMNLYWLLLGIIFVPACIAVVREDFRRQQNARNTMKQS